MSKGSRRRDAQIPDAELEDRWAKTFPPRPTVLRNPDVSPNFPSCARPVAGQRTPVEGAKGTDGSVSTGPARCPYPPFNPRH